MKVAIPVTEQRGIQENAIAVPQFVVPQVNNGKIEELEKHLLPIDQIECPLTHRFAPGIYLREIFMPAGAFVIGHEHKTEHFNIILKGYARVLVDNEALDIHAPITFVSKPGVRKVLYIYEDMVWQTVHPTDETDLDKLEELLIVKSDSWKTYHKQIERMKKELAS